MTQTLPTPARNRVLGFGACTLAGMFWGCGFFFGKIALAEMNSGAMVLYRFLFASLGLLPFVLTHRPGRNRPALSRKDWLILLFASFLGVPLQFLFQFHGLALTTVSHAALMVGTMPVLLAVGATFYAHERLHPLGWVALFVSTIGAALIALGGDHHAATSAANGPTLRGDLFVVFSLCIALFWVLLNQRLVAHHSPIVITAYGLCAGTVMLLLVVPFLYGLPPIHHISLKVWLALAASGLLCTASSTMLWNYGMTRVPASQAGVLLNMEPLIGSLLGVFVLHEHLGSLGLLGGALILAAAITLTTRSARTQATPESIAF
ncbi:MAG TPA: EamA family transporter [Acidobacteriaceae bacterium]|jgi:drug/metabolite transporter (DMT)-like permease|nr:EamA family transporter [Acidobacteriaceae bacterium]